MRRILSYPLAFCALCVWLSVACSNAARTPPKAATAALSNAPEKPASEPLPEPEQDDLLRLMKMTPGTEGKTFAIDGIDHAIDDVSVVSMDEPSDGASLYAALVLLAPVPDPEEEREEREQDEDSMGPDEDRSLQYVLLAVRQQRDGTLELVDQSEGSASASGTEGAVVELDVSMSLEQMSPTREAIHLTIKSRGGGYAHSTTQVDETLFAVTEEGLSSVLETMSIVSDDDTTATRNEVSWSWLDTQTDGYYDIEVTTTETEQVWVERGEPLTGQSTVERYVWDGLGYESFETLSKTDLSEPAADEADDDDDDDDDDDGA